MNTSKDLFNLIRSLTKSEKRYFKICYKSDTVYSKLFDEIINQAEKGIYNEEKIKQKFKNEKFVKQLTYTKNYLYKLVSNSLIQFHSKDNIESYIYSLITSAKIFFRKSLFENYFKNIEKALLLAEKYERFGILLELIALQKHLIRAKDLKKIKLSDLQRKEQNIFKMLNNISDLAKLYGALNMNVKRMNESSRKYSIIAIEKILDHSLLSTEKNAMTVQAKDVFYDMKIFKADFNNDIDEVIYFLLKKRENYINNEEIFKMNVNFQLSTITYNLAAYYLEKGNVKEFEKYFNYYKDIQAKDNITGLLNDLDLNSLLLRFVFLKKNAEDFKKYSTSVLKYAKENEEKITKDYLLSIYFNIAVLQFDSGDFENSLNTLNILLNHRYKNFRKDLITAGNLLSLFIHYELENFELLESLIRPLKRNSTLTGTQKTISTYLLKLINFRSTVNKKKQHELLNDFRSEIKKLKKDRFEKHLLRYFDPEEWIIKKLETNK